MKMVVQMVDILKSTTSVFPISFNKIKSMYEAMNVLS